MGVSSRVERLRALMAKENHEVVVVMSPENTLYFAETYIMTQTAVRDRLAIMVIPIDKDPILIGCSIETENIEAETWIKDKRYYTEFVHNPVAVLANVLKEKGYENSKIGLELSYLMVNYYQDLVSLLPKAEFLNCTHLFDKIRMIKDQKELGILTRAAQSTLKMMLKALQDTHPGDTEEMFASKVKTNMLNDGAEAIAFFMIGTGKDTLMAHKVADKTILQDGEICRIDWAGLYNPVYWSDVARTFIIGKEEPSMLNHIKNFAEVYYKTIDMMRPGVKPSELFLFCKKQMEEKGLQFTPPHIGHSIGLILHEFPMLSPKEDITLEENMVFNVEPACITPNGRKIHMEDLIQITATGYKVLSDPDFNPGPLYIK